MLHSPPPTRRVSLPVPRLILGTKKKMFRCLGGLVPSSSTTPQLRCLAAKLRCNRTGRRKKEAVFSLISAITAFASRTLHKMMKRKQNAFELAEPLQDVGKIAKRQNWLSIFIFFFPRDLICLHACILVIYSDTSLCLAALSMFKYTLGIDKDRSHSRHFFPPLNNDYQEERRNRLGCDIFILRKKKTSKAIQSKCSKKFSESLVHDSEFLGFIHRPQYKSTPCTEAAIFWFEVLMPRLEM